MRSLLSSRRENVALALSAVAVLASAGAPGWAASVLNGKQLKNKSVVGKKLAIGAVSNSRLASNAVTGSKIKNGAVGSIDVANGSLARADVAPDFFVGLQTALTAGTIYTDLLADNAVTTAKIGNAQVTGVKIDPGAVSNTRLLNNAVTSSKIEDGSVAGADLADGAVTSAKVADATIATGDIAPNGVTGADFEATGAAALNFPVIAQQTCQTLPVSVTGADLSDDAIVVTPGAGFTAFGATASVQSATQFSVTVCNPTTADVDPDGSGTTYRWVAIQG